jgi:hypothetical protein
MKSHLSILSLSCWAAGVLLRKSLSIPISSRVFPAHSCTSFRVSGLILRSLIHFEFILAQGDRHSSRFSFLQMENHFSHQHLLKSLSFLHIFGPFVKNKVGILVWIHIWVLYSVPLVFTSVFALVPCCFYWYCFVI